MNKIFHHIHYLIDEKVWAFVSRLFHSNVCLAPIRPDLDQQLNGKFIFLKILQKPRVGIDFHMSKSEQLRVSMSNN